MIHREAWYRETSGGSEELQRLLGLIYRGEGDTEELKRAKIIQERIQDPDLTTLSKLRHAHVWIAAFKHSRAVLREDPPEGLEKLYEPLKKAAQAFLKNPELDELVDLGTASKEYYEVYGRRRRW